MWCEQCRTMRTVLDVHHEEELDGGSNAGRRYAYQVADLVCGHEVATKPTPMGDGPGDRYAGHNERLDARDRQAAEDAGQVTQ